MFPLLEMELWKVEQQPGPRDSWAPFFIRCIKSHRDLEEIQRDQLPGARVSTEYGIETQSVGMEKFGPTMDRAW